MTSVFDGPEPAAIRVLREHAAQATAEWAEQIRGRNGEGINMVYAEARAAYIMDLIRSINDLKDH